MKNRRAIAAVMLAFVLFINSGIYVYAAAQIISDEGARRALPIATNDIEDWPQGPVVSAQSAVVMEAETGAVLYEKNSHDPLYPASITKILTTLVALENSGLDETVTFSHDSVFSLDEGSSIIGGVNEGDKMSMKDVLYGIMICSGNEAAHAAAEHVAGSVDAFTDMMNARAKEAGCTDSNFENPHGLPDSDHVTSAMDMALITKAALENNAFKTIATTRRYTFPPTSRGEERIRLNHHKMMQGMEYEYDGCLGGKTGYTSKAGSTLVTFAERDGILLICVVMNERSPYHFRDTATLLDYGFANFRKVDMSSYGQESTGEEGSFFLSEVNSTAADTGLSINRSGTAVIPLHASIDAIMGKAQEEQADGTVISDFYYNGAHVGSSIMQIQAEPEGQVAGRLFGGPETKVETTYNIFDPADVKYVFINLKIVLTVLLGITAITAIIVIYVKTGKRRRRRRRHLERRTNRDFGKGLIVKKKRRFR